MAESAVESRIWIPPAMRSVTRWALNKCLLDQFHENLDQNGKTEERKGSFGIRD